MKNELKAALLSGQQVSVGICDISIYVENVNRFDDSEQPEYIVTESYPSNVDKYKFSDVSLALDKFLEVRQELINHVSGIEVY